MTILDSIEQKVRFSWCPAHISIIYNKKVDGLAKEASIWVRSVWPRPDWPPATHRAWTGESL